MDPLFELLTRLSTDPFLQDTAASDPLLLQALLACPPAERAANTGWTPCATLFDPGPDPFEDPDPPKLRA